MKGPAQTGTNVTAKPTVEKVAPTTPAGDDDDEAEEQNDEQWGDDDDDWGEIDVSIVCFDFYAPF